MRRFFPRQAPWCCAPGGPSSPGRDRLHAAHRVSSGATFPRAMDPVRRAIAATAEPRAGGCSGFFAALAVASPQPMHLIGCPIVPAHRHAVGGRRGRITPSAVLVEDRAATAMILLTATGCRRALHLRWQASGKATAPAMLQRRLAAPTAVAGHDWGAPIDPVGRRGEQAGIPRRARKAHGSVDPRICRRRDFVESLFCRLRRFRLVVALRQARTNFLAAARSGQPGRGSGTMFHALGRGLI